MVIEYRDLARWRDDDSETLESRRWELLELAHKRALELANLEDDEDRLTLLARWARRETFQGIPWDLAQKMEGGRHIAVWVLDVLYDELTEAKRRHMIEEVSEGW